MSERVWPHRFAVGAIGLLMLCYVALYACVMLSADSVRDLSTAWALHAHGEWPAQGPDIFSRYTLGPIWFWLLAGLMKLTSSLTVLVVLVGLVASLKLPLAYLLGRKLVGEVAGLVCSVMLALSSVSLIEHWTFAHTNLTVFCSLLVMWCGALLHDRPSDMRWVGFALALVLAMHAHPSAALSGLAVLPALWRNRTQAISPAALCCVGAIVLLAFAPTLMFAANGALWYATPGGGVLTPAISWPSRSVLLWARIVLDPLRLFVEATLSDRTWPFAWVASAFATIGVGAALLLARSKLAWLLFASTVIGAIALVAVRATTPAWMALALLPFAALLIGVGWDALYQRPPKWVVGLLVTCLVPFAIICSTVWLGARGEAADTGVQHLPQHRVANLAWAGNDSQRSQPLLGVLALDRFARRFCADFPHTPLFGDIALGISTAEAVPFLMRGCEHERWPVLGGDGNDPVAGLVRASGAQQGDGWPRIPGYVFVPVQRVIYPQVGIALRERPPYPPITWFGRAQQALKFDVQLVDGELLALSTRYRFEPETTIDITASGAVATLDASSQTRLYRCRDNAECRIELTLHTVIPEVLQLYTLDASAFTRTDRAE